MHRTKNNLIYSRSYGKFSGKIPNFSLPWQQGSSEQSLTDTVKLADPDNPLVGASIWGVSPAQAELYRFCVKNLKFSLPWQPGSAWAKCDWHSWIGRPRKPYNSTKNYDSILYTTEVMLNFLVKFPIFRYHGNSGRLSKVWLTPLNCPIPKTP